MHHYFEAITNKSGDSLPGYFARVVDPATQNTIVLSADNNGTPIVTTSGVENAAKTDENGNVSFYVEPGTYHLDIYAQNATSFIMRVPNVAMNSGRGPQGEQGEQGTPGNGLADTFTQAGSGAKSRTGLDKLRERVSISDFEGVDPTGQTSSNAAIAAALAAGKYVTGAPGAVYLVTGQIPVPEGRQVVGNGATLKLAPGAIGLRTSAKNCTVEGWTIDGNGGLYAVLNEGYNNHFRNNLCQGNVGHFYFATGADLSIVTNNHVDGLTASTEITAAFVSEGSTRILITGNTGEDIPTGWGVHARGRSGDGKESSDITISNNKFTQRQYFDTKIAASGQKVFNFTLAQNVLVDNIKNEPKVRVQVNGKPISPIRPNGTVVYTIQKAPNANNYTITFTDGRTSGESIKLLGYRGAEQIQVNTGCRDYIVSLNTVNGTADTGIIALSPYGSINGNRVKNTGYTGIAIYGDVNHMQVCDNVLEDCSQMDDGFSSPDDYRVPSVFPGGVFVGGEDVLCSGNQFINNSGTMRYAFASNKFCDVRTDGSSAITFHDNHFSGQPFSDGRYFLPNQTPGMRMNSIDVDGAPVAYPAQIDIETAWVERAPAGSGIFDPVSTPYWTVGGTTGVRAVRNTSVTHDGGPSIQTVAGEYLEFTATRIGMLRDCIVTLQFWARNVGGNSYVQAVTQLVGVESPIIVPITDPAWKLYTVRFPFTSDLDTVFKVRVGANIGSANVQNLQVSARRL